jgi:hypothetical protein
LRYSEDMDLAPYLEEGKRLESQIPMDGIFQTELRRKYHLNEQRLQATLALMRDLGILETVAGGVRLTLFQST